MNALLPFECFIRKDASHTCSSNLRVSRKEICLKHMFRFTITFCGVHNAKKPDFIQFYITII